MSIVTEFGSVSSANVSQKVAPDRRVRTKRVLSEFGRYMKERGLTAADAAMALDVTPQYVYTWTREACRPSWKLARKIEAWTAERFGADGAFVVGRWA